MKGLWSAWGQDSSKCHLCHSIYHRGTQNEAGTTHAGAKTRELKFSLFSKKLPLYNETIEIGIMRDDHLAWDYRWRNLYGNRFENPFSSPETEEEEKEEADPVEATAGKFFDIRFNTSWAKVF